MDASKDTGAGKDSDNDGYAEEAGKNIFSFNALQIDDSINQEKRSTANYEDHNLKQADEKVRTSDENELPSRVTDTEYIYMKDPDMKEEDYMIEGGKWMIFTHGDMNKLDAFWMALGPLYRNGILSNLKASTAFESGKGVINCYTADADNWVKVKKAADAIRDVVDYRFIMYYKTNEASAQGLYRERGARLISRYMFTVKRGFYEKDQYNRWMKL